MLYDVDINKEFILYVYRSTQILNRTIQEVLLLLLLLINTMMRLYDIIELRLLNNLMFVVFFI